MHTLLDLFLHLDVHLANVIAQYGTMTYVLLFAVLFCETGLVVTPFLPGDSLLFAAGAFVASGKLHLALLLFLLSMAAVLGDAVNYWVGRKFGAAVLAKGTFLGLPVKKEHLERTKYFFEKYGSKTIVIARFMPIVRTLAPFVAGVGRMQYRRFAIFNIVGGLLWVSLFVFGGYFFGNLPIVRHNFTLVILAVIVISLIPPSIEVWRSKKNLSS